MLGEFALKPTSTNMQCSDTVIAISEHMDVPIHEAFSILIGVSRVFTNMMLARQMFVLPEVLTAMRTKATSPNNVVVKLRIARGFNKMLVQEPLLTPQKLRIGSNCHKVLDYLFGWWGNLHEAKEVTIKYPKIMIGNKVPMSVARYNRRRKAKRRRRLRNV